MTRKGNFQVDSLRRVSLGPFFVKQPSPMCSSGGGGGSGSDEIFSSAAQRRGGATNSGPRYALEAANLSYI